MKFFILVALGFAFTIAIPQNEERSRVRGIRRFSLATPGLQAGRVSENEVVSDLGENKSPTAEGEEPRTRSRGASLLRRGHPSRRLIARPAAENQDSATTITEEAVENAPGKEVSRGREGVRIRRPLKKITVATSPPITAQPVTEDIASESAQITPTTAISTLFSEAGTDMLKTEEGMLTEESKPVMKDEVMQDPGVQEALHPQEQSISVVGDSNKEESIIPKTEEKSQGLPRPKKLRPIPIKLGRRGQADAGQQETQAEAISPENQEQTNVGDNQPSSHRFASRPRPQLQSRRRIVNKQANQQPTETEPAAAEETQAPAAAEEAHAPAEESIKKTQTRLRVPIVGRNPAKSPRRRISQQPEGQEESPALESTVDDSIIPSQNLKTSLPDAEELIPLLTNPVIQDQIPILTQKPRRIRPRIKKPTPSQQPDTVQDIRAEIDSSSPSIEAPISEAVRKGRPQKNLEDSTLTSESPTQFRVAISNSKFPTPHYGGRDLVYRGGEVHVTQIGTIEDTPTAEVHRILSGLGSKRRGLGRPRTATTPPQTSEATSTLTDTDAPSSNKDLQKNIDYIYDYYEQ